MQLSLHLLILLMLISTLNIKLYRLKLIAVGKNGDRSFFTQNEGVVNLNLECKNFQNDQNPHWHLKELVLVLINEVLK